MFHCPFVADHNLTIVCHAEYYLSLVVDHDLTMVDLSEFDFSMVINHNNRPQYICMMQTII